MKNQIPGGGRHMKFNPTPHEPLDPKDVHVDRVVKLPYRKVRLSDGTVVQPSWSPENVAGHENTQSWVRSVDESNREPNPAGDPTHGMKQRVTFARPVEVEPTVSFRGDQKFVSYDQGHVAQAPAVKPATPTTPRRRVVGGQ